MVVVVVVGGGTLASAYCQTPASTIAGAIVSTASTANGTGRAGRLEVRWPGCLNGCTQMAGARVQRRAYSCCRPHALSLRD